MHADFATHYYLADKKPFLNLCDLENEQLGRVLDDLQSRYIEEDFNRVYGTKYINLRRKTEHRLRELFISAGGKPQRRSPHYFVLGESYWFKHLCSNTKEVKIPLSYFSSNVVSFTYPDSFVAMGYMPEFGMPVEEMPYHGKAFRLDDLSTIIEKHGVPEDDYRKEYNNYANENFEKFIEIQVWDDSPLEWLQTK